MKKNDWYTPIEWCNVYCCNTSNVPLLRVGDIEELYCFILEIIGGCYCYVVGKISKFISTPGILRDLYVEAGIHPTIHFTLKLHTVQQTILLKNYRCVVVDMMHA